MPNEEFAACLVNTFYGMLFIQVFRTMQIVVLADEQQQQELSEAVSGNATIRWITSLEELAEQPGAEVIMDLLFVNEKKRIERLRTVAKTVVINSVTDTLTDADSSFVRINGWSTFLKSPVLEAAAANEAVKEEAEAAFSLFNKSIQWVADQPGFITARVVSMIINEAYLALGEGISTKEEIDTAMKLGTAYPFGPFEWAEKVGVQNIVKLLQQLAKLNPKYTPAELLVQLIQL